MSAVFGIIYKRDAGNMSANAAAMQQALAHRAVDGSGIWRSQSVFMGCQQLTLNARQGSGSQPFEDEDLVIAADALLFDRRHLFSLLSIDKERWSSYSDAKLILLAYRKWGTDCARYLEGEFAFTIYNKVSGALFCATDQVGFRPLYYHESPDMFVFCSEIKGIIAVKRTPNVFNEEAIIEYYFRQSDKSRTYTKDVLSLCSGNSLVWDEKGVSVTKYWNPGPTGKYRFAKYDEWTACLRELIEQAVEDRIDTDHPVGVTLSGGLDSSAIACIAGRMLQKRNKPLYAFSSVLPDNYNGPATDERSYVQLLGKHIKNLEQVYITAPDSGMFSGVQEAILADEGIPNGFFYIDQAIVHAAQQKGVRVLLSGFGGDFFVSWKGNSVIYQLARQGRLTKAARIFAETKKYEQAGLVQLLKTDIIAHSGFYEQIMPFLHRRRHNWYRSPTINKDFFLRYKDSIDFRSATDQIAFMKDQLAFGHTGRLCSMYTNRDAMYGINSAMPLFDRRILEFMFDVPLEHFRKDGTRRSMIRNAMNGILPQEIQWRRDKLPYSPDYVSRLQDSKQFINTLLNSEDYTFVWQYIDKSSIINNIDGLRDAAGMGKVSEIGGIRIIQAVICVAFLKWLSVNNYTLK